MSPLHINSCASKCGISSATRLIGDMRVIFEQASLSECRAGQRFKYHLRSFKVSEAHSVALFWYPPVGPTRIIRELTGCQDNLIFPSFHLYSETGTRVQPLAPLGIVGLRSQWPIIELTAQHTYQYSFSGGANSA